MAQMTVAGMIEALQDLIREDEANADLEVRFAYQESYPLQDRINQHDIAVRRESERSERRAVYLLSAGQVYDAPYAPSGIFGGRLTDEPDEVVCPVCEGTLVTTINAPRGIEFKCNRARCGASFDASDLPYDG